MCRENTADGALRNAYSGQFAHMEIWFLCDADLIVYVEELMHPKEFGGIYTSSVVNEATNKNETGCVLSSPYTLIFLSLLSFGGCLFICLFWEDISCSPG